MKTKAICPKCGADITTWRGQIAVCTNTKEYVMGLDIVKMYCGYQGTYPKRVEVEEGTR